MENYRIMGSMNESALVNPSGKEDHNERIKTVDEITALMRCQLSYLA